MNNRKPRWRWTCLGGRLAAGLALLALAAPAAGQFSAAPKKSFGDSVKDGWNNLTGANKPPPPPKEGDTLALTNASKPGPGVYLAVARLYEQAGKLDEAEKQYQLALKNKPNDLAAMLGYAKLKERMNKPDDAVRIYLQAAKLYPNEASVYNNLGLCHARRNMNADALQALGRAVLLQPKNPLYRNNIATVLVDTGRLQEALAQMQAVHGEAAAYFNLGYLLQKKGQTQQAIQAFSTALRFDPNMVQAQQWIERLSNPTMAAAPSGPTSVPAAAPYGAAAPPGPYGVRPTGPYAGNVAMPPGPPRYAAPTTVPPPPASAWPPAAPMQPMPPMQPTHAPPYAIEPTVLPPPAAPSSAAPGVAAPPAMTPPAAAPNIYSEPSAATPPALSAPQNGPNAGLRLSNRRPSPTAETAPLPPAMPDSLQRLPTVR